jgi:hypothetical protein
MDMPAVVTPSVNVTDMACVGHVVYTIAFPQLCGLTPTFAWLYIHMSVTRWDVTPRNACLWPQALLQGRQHGYVQGSHFYLGSCRIAAGPLHGRSWTLGWIQSSRIQISSIQPWKIRENRQIVMPSLVQRQLAPRTGCRHPHPPLPSPGDQSRAAGGRGRGTLYHASARARSTTGTGEVRGGGHWHHDG